MTAVKLLYFAKGNGNPEPYDSGQVAIFRQRKWESRTL